MKTIFRGAWIIIAAYLLLCLLPTSQLFAQPDIFWSRTFDFQYNRDHLTSVRGHPDGGLIVSGNTLHPADSTYTPYLIKLDSDLRVEWTRILDDKGRAEEIIALPNGYYAVGDNDSGMVLGSLDRYCNPEWGVGYDETGAESCRGMVGGGINDWIVFGNTTNPDRALAVSYSIYGEQNWVYEASSFGVDAPMMSGSTAPSGEIAVFYRNPDGMNVRLLHPLTGEVLSHRLLYFEVPTGSGRGFVSSDTGYVFAGQRYGEEAFLAKCDDLNQQLWDRGFATNLGHSYFNSVIETSDGGYLAVGVGEDMQSEIYQKAYAVKTDVFGFEEWSFLFPNANYSVFNDVIEIGPEQFVMVGERGANDDEDLRGFLAVFGRDEPQPQLSLYLYRTSEYIIPGWGANLWYQARMVNPFAAPVTVDVWRSAYMPGGYYYPIDDEPVQLIVQPGETTDLYQLEVPPNTPAGNITLLVHMGTWPDEPTTTGSVIFRKLPFTDVAELAPNAPLPDRVELTSVAPNPFNASTTITLALPAPQEIEVAVVDVLGRQVAALHDGTLPVGHHRMQWDASGHASGMYFVRVTNNSRVFDQRKIVLLR